MDYRIESEPMLSFILEDLHGEMTKTKYRYYMAFTNAKLILTWLTRQNNANKIQPKPLILLKEAEMVVQF